MTAFDVAMAALCADPNLGSDAVWRPGGGAAVSLRVVRETTETAPGARSRTKVETVTMSRAELPVAPVRGDDFAMPPLVGRIDAVEEPDPYSYRLIIAWA